MIFTRVATFVFCSSALLASLVTAKPEDGVEGGGVGDVMGATDPDRNLREARNLYDSGGSASMMGGMMGGSMMGGSMMGGSMMGSGNPEPPTPCTSDCD